MSILFKRKTCRCDKEFRPTHGHQKHCSERCRIDVKFERRTGRRRDEIKTVVCVVCGEEFISSHPKARNEKYCSDQCIIYVRNKRKREKTKAEHVILSLNCELCGEQCTAVNNNQKYCNNKECIKIRMNIYSVEHYTKHPESAINARTKRRGVNGKHSMEEWSILNILLGNHCLGCWKTNVKFHQDHIIPITPPKSKPSYLKGDNTIYNIQPL